MNMYAKVPHVNLEHIHLPLSSSHPTPSHLATLTRRRDGAPSVEFLFRFFPRAVPPLLIPYLK